MAKSKGSQNIIIIKKGGEGHAAHHGGSWKVAYADFVTAMMAFFLLMWLIAALKPQQKESLSIVFKDVKKDATQVTKQVVMATFIPKDAKVGVAEMNLSEKDQLKYQVALLVKELLAKDQDLQNNSGISSDNAGVLMQVNNSVMFAPNSAVLKPEAAKMLEGVTNIMLSQKVNLVIRGHTDDTENGSGLYPSKWELSAARAAACLRFILAKGNGAIAATRMRAAGYADSRPLVPIFDDASRSANRRVEFYYHSPETETW
ncbi:MAG: flagellar motor protein MotB [Humidesulfovibrio sp.]|uniref:OmpA/MotB family protein n=1 Tax=Humidesulfovibrio sp. TaxID=2910988 RepID=UPI0027E7601B|nr:flagellar motor protein MotB [Humidesulfovibrio sp.]MDQ7834025.1 flagellar motor protein MotB [Humidesulfovibrio sp.]